MNAGCQERKLRHVSNLPDRLGKEKLEEGHCIVTMKPLSRRPTCDCNRILLASAAAAALLLMLVSRPASGHVRLEFPRARDLPFDFLDSVRTPAPCGVPRQKFAQYFLYFRYDGS